MQQYRSRLALLLFAGLVSCGTDPDAVVDSLRSLSDFPMGVAVPADPWPNSLLTSHERQDVVLRHFNSITAENAMKSAYLQPAPGQFAFEHADALVAFAKQHNLLVHGHALVWHKQAPDWLQNLEGPVEVYRSALISHVQTVAEHYAGTVSSWDVVNEAFDDNTPADYRRTYWYEHLGPEYVELAFRTARRAAPGADLYYNDYDISGASGPAKLERVLQMVSAFQARDVPIDGIGFQMHIDMEAPAMQSIHDAFAKTAALGVKVRISELDVSVNAANAYASLSGALAAAQRQRYADIVRTYIKAVPPGQRGGITVWGITDADSWIQDFRQRSDWPLLFNADFSGKPALRGMADGLDSARQPR